MVVTGKKCLRGRHSHIGAITRQRKCLLVFLFCEQSFGIGKARLHLNHSRALAYIRHRFQIVAGVFAACLDGGAQPLFSFAIVLVDPGASHIAYAKRAHSVGITALCASPVILRGFADIARQAFAILVHTCKKIACAGIPRLCHTAYEIECLLVSFLRTEALGIG